MTVPNIRLEPVRGVTDIIRLRLTLNLILIMRRFERILICRLLLATSLAIIALNSLSSRAAEGQNNIPPAGFTALFNGTDLAGWWGADTENPRDYMNLPKAEFDAKRNGSLENIRKHWSVQNDELVNDGHGLFLTTDKFYGNFELLVDYRTVPRADSGIYLRGCPQVQIWDSTEEAKFNIGADKGSGGLWNNRPGSPGKDPLVKADKPFGEWNRFRIIMAGSRVWIWLNGQQTVNGATLHNYFDAKTPVPARGPIQLQTHGGEIRWRNVFIRELGSEEATKLLRGADPAGFQSVFNGKDFSGWAGAVDHYEVKENAIVCKPDKGGTLYTQDEFTNFVVRLEFKVPPGGNNGLAIRDSGTGDPAYQGMCELQILDERYEQVKGSKLDPRQRHGSAYGMAAAHQGYQFPAGEWNYQEVVVNGSTIRVELNGTEILNADLSKITEFMNNNRHPGKDRTSGHFGFAGHNDPVMFRNISIKRLD